MDHAPCLFGGPIRFSFAAAERRRNAFAGAWVGLACLLLASCAVTDQATGPATDLRNADQETATAKTQADRPPQAIKYKTPPQLAETKGPEATIKRGTDQFVTTPAQARVTQAGQNSIVLNFEEAEIRDVVQIVLGDILKVNYTFDPEVIGTTSLETVSPLPIDAVLDVLETSLRVNGAALVVRNGVYHVLPIEKAIEAFGAPELMRESTPIPAGYSLRIVPLQFVGAEQMELLLQPFLTDESILHVDMERNLLVLAGTAPQMKRLVETIRAFDIDVLEGMSVGIFPLQNVGVEPVIAELDALFGNDDGGVAADLVDFMPIERLNAVMVIAKRATYLDKAKEWIANLDQGAQTGLNLYIFQVQNSKATDLAPLLNDIFAASIESEIASYRAEVAPGRNPVQMNSPGLDIPGATSTGPAMENAVAVPGSPPARASINEGLTLSGSQNIRILADDNTNSLLILASARDYAMIEAALQKLDVTPLQVLVEATIAEVTLTDELKYGLQYFFETSVDGRPSTGTLSSIASGALLPSFPGFSFVVNDPARFVLNALESITEVNVISSPNLMVLDNQTALLTVGDEVPVVTQQQQTSATSDANLVNTVEYRNTGVIFEVTPRVNSNGSINMEITQEVSNVAPGVGSSLTPTISQRKISSSIVVQSGQTVVLGGLFSENASTGKSGVPGLSRIPKLGALFRNTTNKAATTELIVLISPRIARDAEEAQEVTAEIRDRLRTLRVKNRPRIRDTDFNDQ